MQGDIWDPFHTKEEKITMWKNLWANQQNTEYFTVGKTYDGTDILLFAAGDPTGGRVLWDGEMHGNEDKGSEILFLMAKWLLESDDPQANSILDQNYVMFIPQVNIQDRRGNGDTANSPYGVDLNRNFATGWTKSNTNDDIYSGPTPISEPETRVMRTVFSTYQPTFYVNMHVGGGPYAAYYNGGNTTLSEQVKNATKNICQEMGIAPYSTRVFGSQGYAMGDAAELGVKSTWLIEAVGETTAWRHLPEHYSELVDTYFPKCKALFIAMCRLSTPPEKTTSKVVFLDQNPAQNAVYYQDKVTIQATLTPSSTAIKSVTLEYAIDTTQHFQQNMIAISDNVWAAQIPSMTQTTFVSYLVKVEDETGHITTSEETGDTHSYVVLPIPTPTPDPTLRPTRTPTRTSSPSQTPQSTSSTPTTPPKSPSPDPLASQSPTPSQSAEPTKTPSQLNTSTPNPSDSPQPEQTSTTEPTNANESNAVSLCLIGAVLGVMIAVPAILVIRKKPDKFEKNPKDKINSKPSDKREA